MNFSPTQLWIIIGAALLIVELLSVSLVFVFLSIGALATAITTWIGITPNLNGQVLVFSLVSVGSMLLLRKPLKKIFKRDGKEIQHSEYIGDKANVVVQITANSEGKVFYRGSEWIAISETGATIDIGKSVAIRALDGIKLIVSEV
jgi:inner membrane protein